MKKYILIGLLVFASQLNLNSQNLTVEMCQEKAKVNYPLVKQYGLIEQTAQYNISNANKGYLPQLTLSARGTYQSQVTKLPITLPNLIIPELSKDQYQAVLEASQVIWDGGVISAQKKITNANTEVEKQKLEVDLFALNERVNQLFFGILLINEQIIQTVILENELLTNYNRVNAYKQNGVANQSDLDAIKVEQINVMQRKSELKSTQKSYLLMLSTLIGLALDEKTELVKPELDLSVLKETDNKRPELGLFVAQNQLLESQKSLLNAGNLPKIGAFLQGGYGKPGLNMLTNSFSEFYIGGIRLLWNISGFYTQKNNINKIETSKKSVVIQKETFLFNSDLKTKQQQTEIEKLESILSNDDEIIRLRENIKKSANAKVENGTLTVSDLIREINAENQARQLKSLHEIQLIMNIYQLKNNINK
ncbi:MAG: TolC family protein [Paludibacter sp.]|nr:TolC family protein [Paludibacter sp.]